MEEDSSSHSDDAMFGDGEALQLDIDMEPDEMNRDEANAHENQNEEVQRNVHQPLVRRVVRLLGLDGNVALNWALNRDGEEEFASSSSDDGTDEDAPKQDMDRQMPATHSYLFKSSGSDDVPSPNWIEPGAVVRLPIVQIEIVLLPDQYLPLQSELPSYRRTILCAIQNKTYLAVLPYLENDQNNVIGTLMQINRYSDNEEVVKVHGCGRQRFKLLERHTNIDGSRSADVEVLGERVMAPFVRDVIPGNCLKKSKKHQLSIASHMCGVPVWIIEANSTENRCARLSEWMKDWCSDEKVKCALDLGPISFSYFLAANLPVDLQTKARFLQEDCTDKRIADLYANVMKMSDIVCKVCGSEVCRLSDICNLNAEGNSSHFVNNAGYVHEMLTVSEANNFMPKGRPTGLNSWFVGYKWQIIECSMCMSHLGWEFTSKKFLPAKFFGLTRKAVIPKQIEDMKDL